MTDGDLQAAVRGYEAVWNETAADKRMSALESAWTEDAAYVDDDVPDGAARPRRVVEIHRGGNTTAIPAS